MFPAAIATAFIGIILASPFAYMDNECMNTWINDDNDDDDDNGIESIDEMSSGE